MMVHFGQPQNTTWCPYLDTLHEDLFIKTILCNLGGIYSLAKGKHRCSSVWNCKGGVAEMWRQITPGLFFMLSVSSGYLTLYRFMVLRDAHHCSV